VHANATIKDNNWTIIYSTAVIVIFKNIPLFYILCVLCSLLSACYLRPADMWSRIKTKYSLVLSGVRLHSECPVAEEGGGKEGRRDGGKEGRRDGGKEGRREGGKEGRREGGRREGGRREGGMEGRRDGGKEGGNALHDNAYICLPFCSLSYRGPSLWRGAVVVTGGWRYGGGGGKRWVAEGEGLSEGRLVTQTPL